MSHITASEVNVTRTDTFFCLAIRNASTPQLQLRSYVFISPLNVATDPSKTSEAPTKANSTGMCFRKGKELFSLPTGSPLRFGGKQRARKAAVQTKRRPVGRLGAIRPAMNSLSIYTINKGHTLLYILAASGVTGQTASEMEALVNGRAYMAVMFYPCGANHSFLAPTQPPVLYLPLQIR